MALRAKALPVLIAALLLAGTVLVLASALPLAGVPATSVMKRVPQHLMMAEPGSNAATHGLKPGDVVTYFCRVHPFMRGAFKVVS